MRAAVDCLTPPSPTRWSSSTSAPRSPSRGRRRIGRLTHRSKRCSTSSSRRRRKATPRTARSARPASAGKLAERRRTGSATTRPGGSAPRSPVKTGSRLGRTHRPRQMAQKLRLPPCPEKASGHAWQLAREHSTKDCQVKACEACGHGRVHSRIDNRGEHRDAQSSSCRDGVTSLETVRSRFVTARMQPPLPVHRHERHRAPADPPSRTGSTTWLQAPSHNANPSQHAPPTTPRSLPSSVAPHRAPRKNNFRFFVTWVRWCSSIWAGSCRV